MNFHGLPRREGGTFGRKVQPARDIRLLDMMVAYSLNSSDSMEVMS